ncbi:MAG: hypothetical protein B7Z37_21115 [Verrucomicrobia bacterium 12-59-8]|nr:MAG: hypothetical protein B7Z37_21115 [Verrucomicrobia bacterium 12-59-8]
MKKSTLRSTVLFTVLVLTIPAALVYLAAEVNEARKWEQYKKSTSQADQAAIAYVVEANELREQLPDSPLKTILTLVPQPLPTGFIVREVDAREREKYPWLEDSDFLVQQTVPPHLVIPSDAPPLHFDLTSAAPPAK